MKELEEKAEQLIEKQRLYLEEVYSDAIEYDQMKLDDKDIIHSCIMGVNHTIEVLESIRSELIKTNWYVYSSLIDAINEQIQLKKILESRL
jgi:hypothetical protein